MNIKGQNLNAKLSPRTNVRDPVGKRSIREISRCARNDTVGILGFIWHLKFELGISKRLHRVNRIILLSLTSYFLLLASITYAQSLPNPLDTTSPATLVGRFIKSIIPFLGAAALIMFVVGAIHWILSSGNPEKVKKGQDTVVWAVLGAAVAIGSYLALKFIINVIAGSLKFT